MTDLNQFPSPATGSKKTIIAVVAVLVFVVLLAIIGLYVTRVYKKPGATTSDLIPQLLKSSEVSKINLKTEYQNPFDKDTQYVNPFSEFKSPFQSLQ